MHDSKGNVLRVGDRVVIRGRIKSLDNSSKDYCNVTVETEEGRLPDKLKETLSLNTKVLDLVHEVQPEPTSEPKPTPETTQD